MRRFRLLDFLPRGGGDGNEAVYGGGGGDGKAVYGGGGGDGEEVSYGGGGREDAEASIASIAACLLWL